MLKTGFRLSFGVINVLLLVGCSAFASPVLVASQPLTTPIAVFPPPPDRMWSTYLELIVHDVDQASLQTRRITQDYNGIIRNSNTWLQNSEKNVSMEILVPAYHFDELRYELLKLGQLADEKPPNLDHPPTIDDHAFYATVYLRLREIYPISRPLRPRIGGWDPGRTFQRASAVFVHIFGFMVDVLIWIVVVAGPFVAIGLAIWWLIRRLGNSKPSGR